MSVCVEIVTFLIKRKVGTGIFLGMVFFVIVTGIGGQTSARKRYHGSTLVTRADEVTA